MVFLSVRAYAGSGVILERLNRGKFSGNRVSQPAYIGLYEEGLLEERIQKAEEMLKKCRVCPRECGADRLAEEQGVCRTGARAMVSSYSPHFGEEDPLVGTGGSGTIFITNCNHLCAFCQNYDISHQGRGREVGPEVLAGLMVELKKSGCHNINFVSPSHVVPQILKALPYAIEAGLDVPLVYNSGGYDSIETLKLLDRVFDIYMPDFKFWDNEVAMKYCGIPDYQEKACEAIREMHRQVGDLEIDEQGLATRGLLVRHLVLPQGLAGTKQICSFLAEKISQGTYVNIMGQYHPSGEARDYPELSRALKRDELETAKQMALEVGLDRLDERRRRSFLVFSR